MWDDIVVFIELRLALEDFYTRQQQLWQDYWNKITDFGQKELSLKRRKKPAILDDFPTQDDWSILSMYNQLLEPLYHATQRLEGRGGGASHGAILQVIPAKKKPLTHLEAAKDEYSVVRPTQDYSVVDSQASTLSETYNSQLSTPPTRTNTRRGKAKQSQSQLSQSMPPPALPPYPPSTSSELIRNTLEYRMLCVGVNLGWKKLDEYYQETDQSPVYVAAVVLHPGSKWKWLEKAWKDRPQWIKEAKNNVQLLWSEYASLPVTDEDLQSAMPEDNDRWMDDDLLSDFSDLDNSTGDVYVRWCKEGRQPKEFRPPEFPSTQRQRESYPRLLEMARDLFPSPAMSDKPERVFSSAGLMVTPL
jgi:hypothetical protein